MGALRSERMSKVSLDRCNLLRAAITGKRNAVIKKYQKAQSQKVYSFNIPIEFNTSRCNYSGITEVQTNR